MSPTPAQLIDQAQEARLDRLEQSQATTAEKTASIAAYQKSTLRSVQEIGEKIDRLGDKMDAHLERTIVLEQKVNAKALAKDWWKGILAGTIIAIVAAVATQCTGVGQASEAALGQLTGHSSPAAVRLVPASGKGQEGPTYPTTTLAR